MWSPKPRKFKKEACQDTSLASLEDNTFHPLTQNEGRRFGKQCLTSIMVGPVSLPSRMHTKHPKKKQQHLSMNNVAELIQFKDHLQKKKENEVDIPALPIHQSEGMDHAINYSIPTVVRRSDQVLAAKLGNYIKKKTLAHCRSQNQRKITKKWVVKEDDPYTAMVCMTGARRNRQSTRSAARNSDPTERGDSDNTSEGH